MNFLRKNTETNREKFHDNFPFYLHTTNEIKMRKKKIRRRDLPENKKSNLWGAGGSYDNSFQKPLGELEPARRNERWNHFHLAHSQKRRVNLSKNYSWSRVLQQALFSLWRIDSAAWISTRFVFFLILKKMEIFPPCRWGRVIFALIFHEGNRSIHHARLLLFRKTSGERKRK